MKIRKLFSTVVAAAVAISSFAISSSASLYAVTDPHQGAVSTNAMWGVELYNSENGVDYGIDLSEIASVSFLISPYDITGFEGKTGGQVASKFDGDGLGNEYTWAFSDYWGVVDETFGFKTQDKSKDILAETVAPGFYMLTYDIDNPLANGDATTVDRVGVYFQEYGADETDMVVIGAYVCDEDDNVLMTFDEYGTPVEYYYDLLDDTIDEIRTNLAAHETEFTVGFELETIPGGDLGSFCMSLIELAMDHTGVPNEGDYIYGQCSEYGISDLTITYDGENYVFDMDCYIEVFTTKEQEAELDAKVDEILESLDLDGKTDYEKICAIYEYVCDTTDYDYEGLNKGDPLAHSAYATLCRNKSVCQGYAAAIYRLMLEAGIDCRIVIGTGSSPSTGESEAHAWNIVELDGKYYYIDSTWDSDYQDLEDYEWFLKGRNDFLGHQDYTMYYLYGYDMPEESYVPNAHDHSIVNHDAKAPTCTEIGWNAYETCSECDYTTYEEIAATGHKFTDYKTTEEATCEAKGSATAECDNGCGKTDVKELDALGHNYESVDNGCICKNCGKEVDFIYGDANSDGKINNLDVLLMRKFIAGGWEVTVNEEALDVNCDGKVNNLDVLLLRKFIAGGWGVTLGPVA